MAEKIYRFINDKPAARWAVLILIALAMFFGYMFVDVMSPIQALVEAEKGWTPNVYGTYASSEYILNVCGFLILAGIILDKMGIRFTGILSTSLMFAGALIKFEFVFRQFVVLGSFQVFFFSYKFLIIKGFVLFVCPFGPADLYLKREFVLSN